MSYPDKFEGFMINEIGKFKDFKKQPFKPKAFGENDVDIKIECCGVCGSDVHTITGGWGGAPTPLAVGHEVVGRAVKVGSAVRGVKAGDRVGVGAQAWSCRTCPQCAAGDENYCPDQVGTYGSPYPLSADPDQTVSQGGFASHIRAHEYFVFPIPASIPSERAAPLLCAGLTVWAPLVRSGKVRPGNKIAVVGLGGLGHLAVMFAGSRGLGADVTVISHTPAKEEDARRLGASHFVDSTREGWDKPLAMQFDLVLNAADASPRDMSLTSYLGLLKVGCQLHLVGMPDKAIEGLAPQAFMPNGSSIGASHIGNRKECLDMLRFAEDKGLLPEVETLPVGDAGCAEAVDRVDRNDVKYRFTLTDYEKAFGS